MFTFQVTPEILAAFVAGSLSLTFDYFPGLARWYDGLIDSRKKQIMAGLLILSVIVVFAGTCLGWFITNLSCEVRNATDFIYTLLITVAINQTLHKLTKPSVEFKSKMFA